MDNLALSKFESELLTIRIQTGPSTDYFNLKAIVGVQK
jgi:hypothetical protein